MAEKEKISSEEKSKMQDEILEKQNKLDQVFVFILRFMSFFEPLNFFVSYSHTVSSSPSYQRRSNYLTTSFPS